MAKANHSRPRKPRTVQERKNAIKRWKAKFAGVCDKCKGEFREGSLVCRAPEPFQNCIIHFSCHPDWRPGKLG